MLRWGMQVAGSGCREPYLGYRGRLQKAPAGLAGRSCCLWEGGLGCVWGVKRWEIRMVVGVEVEE